MLKCGERGRSQHRNKAFDVRDVLLLSGKYVDDLNRERDSLGRTQRGDSEPDLCVLRGRTWRARSRAEACGNAL